MKGDSDPKLTSIIALNILELGSWEGVNRLIQIEIFLIIKILIASIFEESHQ